MSQKITWVAIGAIALSATIAAGQSTPPSAPPAPPGYAETWSVPVETNPPLLLAIGERAVFVAHSAGIDAHAKADGKLLWSQPRSGITRLVASPHAEAPVVAVTASEVIALDPATGDERWKVSLPESNVRHYLAPFRGDVLTIASGKAVRAYHADGTVAWSTALTATATTALVEQSGVAWLGTEAPSLVRLDMASGKVISETPVDSAPVAIAAGPSGSAYVVAAAPVIAFYRAADSKPSWQWKPKRGLAELVGSPIYGDKFVFVTALDNTLQALDRDSGAVRWRKPLPSRPAPGLRESAGLLVVPLITGQVVRRAPDTGAEASFPEIKLEPDSRLQAFVMDADGAVFTLTFSSKVQSFTAWRPAAPAKSPQHPPRPRPGA